MLLPVLLLVTAFIVYGSLYPWQFHAALIPGNPLLILLNSWDFTANRYLVADTGVNLALYAPFGAAAFLSIRRGRFLAEAAVTLLLALVLSCSMELVQLYDGQRVCSMLDVVTNVAGTALGIGLASRFRLMAGSRPGAGAPLFLLCCWVGALLFPFMPDLSTHHLLYKLSNFTSPPFSPVALFNLLVMWLVAARLMEIAVSFYAVPLLLFVLPVRLFVSGITLAWTDCVPALLAIFIWFGWHPDSRLRDAVLGGLSLAAILITGLAPFHLSETARPFYWVPFRALFSTDWEAGFGIFFRKCLAYGSTIWLFLSAGVTLVRAALGVAFVLSVLEIVQMWLPNHVAESTDPLLALILTWIVSRLMAHQPSATQTVANASFEQAVEKQAMRT